MLSSRPRSVKPNIRWRSARRRSNEKSARQIRREVAAETLHDRIVAAGMAMGLPPPNIPPGHPRYGVGTGPRAQQAKRAK